MANSAMPDEANKKNEKMTERGAMPRAKYACKMSGQKQKYYQTAAAGLQIQCPVRTARYTSSVRDSNITTCCGQEG